MGFILQSLHKPVMQNRRNREENGCPYRYCYHKNNQGFGQNGS